MLAHFWSEGSSGPESIHVRNVSCLSSTERFSPSGASLSHARGSWEVQEQPCLYLSHLNPLCRRKAPNVDAPSSWWGKQRRQKDNFPNFPVATASWKFHFLCTHTSRSGTCALGVLMADAINCK